MRRKFPVPALEISRRKLPRAGPYHAKTARSAPVLTKEIPRMTSAFLIRPAVLAAALLSATAASAAGNGAVRQACAADVHALCSGVKPGSGRVAACMRDNADKLSQGCRQAISTARATRQ
jgi:hypothetical protein